MQQGIQKAHLRYEVPYADTDQMGMIYYANYLVYFERARTRLLDELGYPYPEMERDGLALPVIEAHVEYKAPAEYGDILDVYGWCDRMKGVRLRVRCEVWHGDRLLARGYTAHACIGKGDRRPKPIPARLAAPWAAAMEEGET